MSWNPNDSAIRVNKTLEERIAEATSQAEIQTIMREAAVAQHIVTPDRYDPNVLLEVAPNTARAPQIFTKLFTINGQTKTISADTELGLAQAETKLFRSLMQPDATETRTDNRDERGRFTATQGTADEDAEQAAANVELRLMMIRNEISPEEYLVQSGLVERHLQRVENENIKTGWESATASFFQSPEGANWPGGSEPLTRIGSILEENGLVDAPDKLDALKQAWAVMQQEDYENAVSREIQEAKDPFELRAILQPGSSSLFNR
jgi:hypothetical protein